MSKASGYDVKILKQFMVAPPLGSVPSTSIPLTFFDFPYIHEYSIMQRIFVYDFPHSTHHFLQTFLPSLQNSLSLALSYFFPLSANLVCPPPTLIPHIHYSNNSHNSVSFTVAESTTVHFSNLISHHPQPAQHLQPFMPELTPARVLDDGTRVIGPLMAVQVTILPNSGFIIGITFHHVVTDGRSFHHFMKAWASICRTGRWLNEEESKPYYNRDEVRRTWNQQLELKMMEEWVARFAKSKEPKVLDDMVRTTVVLGRAQIQKLKNWAWVHLQDQEVDDTPHVSSFTVTCGLIWTCLVKSEEGKNSANNVDDDDNKVCCLVVMVDCRNDSEIGIPSTYFGNCLESRIVRLERKELVMGESGIVEALKGIGKKIKEIRRKGFIRDAEKWIEDWKKEREGLISNNMVVVAGSPKFGAYETDFGLGKPNKSELGHVAKGGLIAMGESRDEKGGIEVGLALPKLQMDHFLSILKERLQAYATTMVS